jgi:lipopolysaccharide biosynthesis protein
MRSMRKHLGSLRRNLMEVISKKMRYKKLKHNIMQLAKKNSSATIGDYIKPLALYLPQYHTIPENDLWWGEGFTEWTNVKKAKALFDGHYQPHIPHPDIGYYDLSDVNVMRKQADMAKRYGIFGFCFYYYHFANGKRLLEKPINNWLQAKYIDFPFCYAWANENWTRAWDGGDKEIIMPQDHEATNLLKMMENMLEDFTDKRYIKIGKNYNVPILLIYRPEIIPNFENISSNWRNMAKKTGFDDLYLISMQNFSDIPPIQLGCDAACEFASIKTQPAPWPFEKKNFSDHTHKDMTLTIVQYQDVMRRVKLLHENKYTRFKCVVPSWDNTPRKRERGWVVHGSTPVLFKEMMKDSIYQTLGDSRLLEKGFVFINAWNEWGEGAHLEPDKKNGYKNLEVIREIMSLPLRELL